MTIKGKNTSPISATKVDWALLCRSVAVDQNTNQVSIFNVIDEITINKDANIEEAVAKSKKFQISMEFALITQFEHSLKDNQGIMHVQVEVIDPSKSELGKMNMPLEIQRGKKRTRIIVQFPNLVATKSGSYNFVISLKEDNERVYTEIARVPLEINIK